VLYKNIQNHHFLFQIPNTNYVCVALSGAKLGVYVFGNMDMDLFKKSLIDGSCIGTTLPIVCQKHEKTQASLT
jgi:hypothetical protein